MPYTSKRGSCKRVKNELGDEKMVSRGYNRNIVEATLVPLEGKIPTNRELMLAHIQNGLLDYLQSGAPRVDFKDVCGINNHLYEKKAWENLKPLLESQEVLHQVLQL